MRSLFFIIFITLSAAGCNMRSAPAGTSVFPKQPQYAMNINDRDNIWVFILAGQSNMAGRGVIAPEDTLPDERILTIDSRGELIFAKEPLHYYEPSRSGLDCGVSFARSILRKAPSSIRILLLPTAVGGSSISQWLNDSIHRNVQLYSNLLKKFAIAKKYGILKAVLWHQGESDANDTDIPLYEDRLRKLLAKIRQDTDTNDLPVLIGELGNFAKYQPGFSRINKVLQQYVQSDANSCIVSAKGLKHQGDSLHFDAKSQRLLGKRYARNYLHLFSGLH